MEYLVGLDIGTTAVKALAYSSDVKLIYSSRIEYTVNSPVVGWSELNPDEIYDALINALKEIIGHIGIEGLIGIAFSSAMHSVLAVNEQGVPLTECILWGDLRSAEYAEELQKSGLGAVITKRSGVPVHPMLPLTKIRWLKEKMPETFFKTFKFIGIKEYVIFKLTGQYCVDYSIACATGLFDQEHTIWNDAALEYAGINSQQLSSLVPAEFMIPCKIGNLLNRKTAVNVDIDTDFDRDKSIPVIVGASDGCLANVGSGVFSEDTANVTIGTSGAIRLTVRNGMPKRDQDTRLFRYMLDQQFSVIGGPVNNGGIVLQWFRDNFMPPGEVGIHGRESFTYEVLAMYAEKAPTGCDGLVFLPYLLGERAPHWNPSCKGVFFGIHYKHRYEHFARAVMEGILYGMNDIFRILDEGNGEVKITAIAANGGFAASTFWLQMLADMIGKPVFTYETLEGSALGAVLLGFKSLGIISSLDQGIAKGKELSRFEPNQERHLIYNKNYEQFHRLYDSLKDEFSRTGS